MVQINNVSSIWQPWLHLVIVTIVYLQGMEILTVRLVNEYKVKLFKYRRHNWTVCLHTFLLSPSAESVLEAMLRVGRGGYSYSGEQSPSSGIS
jgi:hypothetical protein